MNIRDLRRVEPIYNSNPTYNDLRRNNNQQNQEQKDKNQQPQKSDPYSQNTIDYYA